MKKCLWKLQNKEKKYVTTSEGLNKLRKIEEMEMQERRNRKLRKKI